MRTKEAFVCYNSAPRYASGESIVVLLQNIRYSKTAYFILSQKCYAEHHFHCVFLLALKQLSLLHVSKYIGKWAERKQERMLSVQHAESTNFKCLNRFV